MIVLPCHLLNSIQKVLQNLPYVNTEGQCVNNYLVHKYAVSEHRKNYKTTRTFLKFFFVHPSFVHSKIKLIVRKEVIRITVTYDS